MHVAFLTNFFLVIWIVIGTIIKAIPGWPGLSCRDMEELSGHVIVKLKLEKISRNWSS